MVETLRRCGSERKGEGCSSLKALAAFLCVLAVGCATSERALKKKGLSPLTGKELELLLSRDRTLTWTNARTMGDATYAADSTATMTWDSGADSGSWRIDENTLCTTWTVVRKKEACFTVYKTGDNQFQQFWPDGAWNADFAFSD